MRTRPAALLAFFVAATLNAADHRNLDGGFPLRVDDAYPVKFREPNFQSVAFYDRRRGGAYEGGVAPEIEYGFAPNWQASFGARLFGRHGGPSEGSGNLQFGLLHNFNTETLRFPALAIEAEAEFPTGRDARGAEVTIRGILTKSAGFNRLHLNASETFVTSPEVADAARAERRQRWQFVGGWDRPVALQSLLIADVIVCQSPLNRGAVVTAVEVGLRQQISPRLVMGFGVGAGITGRSERQPVFVRFAISRAL